MNWLRSMATELMGIVLLASIGLLVWTYIEKVKLERDFASYKTEVSEEKRDLQEKHLVALEKAQKNIERISHDDEKKRQNLANRATRAESASASLRDEIQRLNARSSPEDAGAAAYAVEARAARELLGECSTKHTRMAKSADELRDQVVGLQDFAISVCKAGQ